MPLPTSDELIEKHPQFRQCSSEMIDAAIEQAANMCSEAVFGSNWNAAVRYKACYFLALEMYAQQPNLQKETKPYEDAFKKICAILPTRMVTT